MIKHGEVKYAVCILNGEIKDIDYYNELLKKSSMIVCVDGGANHLYNTNYYVNYVIGDMDSIEKGVLNYFEKFAKVIKYPVEKDFTDSMLAIDVIADIGVDKVYMIGAFGDRADHFLSNLGLLFYAKEKGVDIRIIDENNEIFLLSEGENELFTEMNETVSFVPLSDISKLTLIGFKYELNECDIHMGITRLNSNIVTSQKQKVIYDKGKLLCVRVKNI